MFTQITLTYCGVEATGRTVTEAKQNAARRIERFIETGPSPEIIVAGEYAALLWRTIAYGWEYKLIATPDGGLREGRVYGGNGHDRKADTERECRMHLADLATDWRTCITADDVHPVCEEQRDRREIADRCAWQRRYHAYKDRGFDHNQCHHLASYIGHVVGLEQVPECDAA